ncbi:hypothetical protein ACHAW5_003076 [Stephanodiscus triporus]|uniref:CCHC-type domain-containing protein n=1 Tax=Stephanodiscus triporus TaxID=2934178 RepID=A0ABD3MF77_9STRA
MQKSRVIEATVPVEEAEHQSPTLAFISINNIMSAETIKYTNARRRLDLSSATTVVVANPYLKGSSKSASAKNVVAADGGVRESASSTIITPEAGIEKFFVARERRHVVGDAKPRAARALVTPRDPSDSRVVRGHDDDDDEHKSSAKHGPKRRSLEFSSDEDDSDLYYCRSDDDSRTNNVAKGSRMYDPIEIHSKLDYHHRGELPLDRGRLRAYRFIRDNFLIPRDIEADPKFGVHSGSCFEERVIRAYSLGQLQPKKESKRSGRSLLVCSYCGDQGHIRDGCLKLL